MHQSTIDQIQRKLKQLNAEREKHIQRGNHWEANKLGEKMRVLNNTLDRYGARK